MVFGLLKDTKAGEYRVACTPSEITTLVADGNPVLVQKGAGEKAGFPDERYRAVGAELVGSAEEMYRRCDFLCKVKELEPCEYGLLREGQIIMCCIHPAGHPEEVDAILKSKCIALTAEDCHEYGSPNCEAAGKQGALFGLESLLSIHGGKGKFVGGLCGAPGIKAVILGAGMVGRAALQVLHALGARVTVLDVNMGALRHIGELYGDSVDTCVCTHEAIQALLPTTDLIINAVRWPKERKDFLVTKEDLKLMEKGSVLVDISQDEPGAIESSHSTTQDDPRYIVNGVVHFCVDNIPGAIAQSTSVALAAETLPYYRTILKDGLVEGLAKMPFVRRSLTAYRGILTHEETSAIQGRPWMTPEEALGIADRSLRMAPPCTTTRSTNFIKK